MMLSLVGKRRRQDEDKKEVSVEEVESHVAQLSEVLGKTHSEARQPHAKDRSFTKRVKGEILPEKVRCLDKMYAPPTCLTSSGTLSDVREESKLNQKWLLVNIQSIKVFASWALNRDVWSTDAIQDMVRTSFCFWQEYDDTVEGKAFLRRYKVKSPLPYIAILDPYTGVELQVWNEETTGTEEFCSWLLDFLEVTPSPDAIVDLTV